jgi:hypothetical protein
MRQADQGTRHNMVWAASPAGAAAHANTVPVAAAPLGAGLAICTVVMAVHYAVEQGSTATLCWFVMPVGGEGQAYG